MSTRQVLCTIFSMTFLLGSCGSGESESVATDTEKTHYGGCIMLSQAGEVPGDLYMDSFIVPTDDYKPFTKKLTARGLTLAGRDDISDDFMRRVGKTIAEVFSRSGDIDEALQQEVIRNMYRYKALIPLYQSRDRFSSPDDMAAWNETRSENSVCDVIMAGVPRQVMEVVEHILHYVNDTGLHYTFPDEWAVTTESQLYQFMLEAVDKGYYDVSSYDRIEDEERRIRVSLQEFGYWIISTAWDLQESYGQDENTEWTIKNGADLKEKMPQLYEVYEQTVAKVMRAPNLSTLEEFTN